MPAYGFIWARLDKLTEVGIVSLKERVGKMRDRVRALMLVEHQSLAEMLWEGVLGISTIDIATLNHQSGEAIEVALGKEGAETVVVALTAHEEALANHQRTDVLKTHQRCRAAHYRLREETVGYGVLLVHGNGAEKGQRAVGSLPAFALMCQGGIILLEQLLFSSNLAVEEFVAIAHGTRAEHHDNEGEEIYGQSARRVQRHCTRRCVEPLLHNADDTDIDHQ